MTETTILEFDDKNLVPLLFGAHNSHLNHLEKKLGIEISDRGNILTFSGDDQSVRDARKILISLWEKLKIKQDVGLPEIDAELRFLSKTPTKKKKARAMSNKKNLTIKTKKKPITPRSPNQGDYLQAILAHDLVFGLGPAGTGKTYLAVAAGVSLYLEGKVERLIFCRPAVEAGENLGFLPGDMKDKVDPYLRPIYDALQDMMPWDFLLKKIEVGEIEIAPLAFMRGRTLSNAFVILDEAQNATPTQMKMFLTRLGESSRMVITGDLSQTDLPGHTKSGLQDAQDTLSGVDEIVFSRFENSDIVRNPLVAKIVDAYDRRS